MLSSIFSNSKVLIVNKVLKIKYKNYYQLFDKVKQIQKIKLLSVSISKLIKLILSGGISG